MMAEGTKNYNKHVEIACFNANRVPFNEREEKTERSERELARENSIRTGILINNKVLLENYTH